jgi:phosphoribosylformimino-5-aminoimidazole carboxamide ribotide isomerase
MRILPVLDLKAGQVVRGIGGRRHEYRPIVSRLTAAAEPCAIAQAFRDHFGLTELYLADLDAIAGAAPSLAIYAALRALGCTLWVDAGVREPAAAERLAGAGIEQVVVGLETVRGPAALDVICGELGGDRVVFSLDLKNGSPLGDTSAWGHADAFALAGRAVEAGVQSLIVLDLARVGTGTGAGTEAMCQRLARNHPRLLVAAGGGVRGVADLLRLKQCGVQAVLVASALHDGSLGREQLAELGLSFDQNQESSEMGAP